MVMKRAREGDEVENGSAVHVKEEPQVKEEADGSEEPSPAVAQEDNEDDNKPLFSNFKMSRAVRRGNECPYLDTISRQVGAGLHRVPTAALISVPDLRANVEFQITVYC